VLCHLDLRGYVTEITVLAVECSEETSGDIDQRGRGASIGRKARSLKGKLSQLLAESRSPRVGLCPPRDESGACLLWNWPREDPVRSSSGIPFEPTLQCACCSELDLTETVRLHEQLC
jgi:hypothetical protein